MVLSQISVRIGGRGGNYARGDEVTVLFVGGSWRGRLFRRRKGRSTGLSTFPDPLGFSVDKTATRAEAGLSLAVAVSPI